jgi:predicted GIY-YIG superfamily endonuclease
MSLQFVTFYTYLLQCNDGSYYTGHTDNLEARLDMHERGILQGYTHSRRPVRLVWSEAFEAREEALEAEWRIKGWSRAKKEALIRGDWDTIRALAAMRSTDRVASGAPLTTAAAHPSRASGRAVLGSANTSANASHPERPT